MVSFHLIVTARALIGLPPLLSKYNQTWQD